MVRSTHPIGIQVEDEPGPFFFSNYINRVDSFSEKKLQYLLIFKCLNLSILAFLNLLLMTITILLTNAILFHLHQAVAVFGKKKGIKSNCQLKQLIYSLENFLGKKKKGFSLLKQEIKHAYSMVNDLCNRDLISWSFTGNTFFIYNAPRFSQEILPIYFKHSNYSSFVRQLNM